MPKYPKKKDTILKYPEAPSGRIQIAKWVPPFMPVEKGHGFVGIIAEDVDSGKLQCHVCGKWYEQLSTHIMKHGYNSGNEYRNEFGLLMSTALKSKRIRLIHSQTCTDSIGKHKMNNGNKPVKGSKANFTKGNKFAGNRKGIKKAQEATNKHGVCDLQIITKIQSLARKIGKTPTLTDVKAEYGGSLITVMHHRYGSYIKYCKEKLKMTPNFSAHNPKYPTKKAWKERIIELGKQSLKEGRIPKNVNRFFPSKSHGRYVYRFWKNFEDYKKDLYKAVNK